MENVAELGRGTPVHESTGLLRFRPGHPPKILIALSESLKPAREMEWIPVRRRRESVRIVALIVSFAGCNKIVNCGTRAPAPMGTKQPCRIGCTACGSSLSVSSMAEKVRCDYAHNLNKQIGYHKSTSANKNYCP